MHRERKWVETVVIATLVMGRNSLGKGAGCMAGTQQWLQLL